MNGVPEARAPLALRSSPGRSASSTSSAGSRNVIASVEPGASAASWRSVAAVASLVRYMLTPVDATTAGRPGSKPAADKPVPPALPGLEVDRHQAQPVGDAEAELDEAATLPRLGAGLVDLEDPEAGAELGPALGESVEAGAEDDVLGDAGGGLLGHQVLDEAGAGHDRGPEPAGADRMHVGTVAPVGVGCRQLQADDVLEHVRRRVDLDVQRPPERDPHGGAVRGVVACHGGRC